MHTEVLLVDDAGQRQGVESIHEIEVNILVVLPAGLLVEIHYLSHLARLVVPPKHDDLRGILEFGRHQQDSHFHSLGTPVYVVAKEEQMLTRTLLERGQDAQDLEQVGELAVDVADDDDWIAYFEDVGLFLWVGRMVLTMRVKSEIISATQLRGSFFSSASSCFSSVRSSCFSCLIWSAETLILQIELIIIKSSRPSLTASHLSPILSPFPN